MKSETSSRRDIILARALNKAFISDLTSISMNKKGDFGWESIAKLLLVIVVIVMLLVLVAYLADVGKEKLALLAGI